MPDPIPAPEPQRVTPEITTSKPVEIKPVEKLLGNPEQNIIAKIQGDSNPDEALRDIADTTPTATIDKPELNSSMVASYLRMTDGLAKEVSTGKLDSETLQRYIKAAREQGVPPDKLEEILLIRGLPIARNTPDSQSSETNPDPNSDIEILRRAADISPLQVTAIKENGDVQGKKIDRSAIALAASGDQTVVRYDGKDWYTIDGRLRMGSINGTPKNFIFTNSGGGAASFDPFTDTYNIHPAALEGFKSDPESFSSGILHEMGHDQYMSLSKAKQMELNDLFLRNPILRDALFKFGAVLYGGKKIAGDENYLAAHSVTNQGIRESGFVTADAEKGFKDARSIVFEIGGQNQEVLVAPLVTEYISYMSSLTVGREVFDKAMDQSRAVRGTTPRLDTIFLGFKRLNADAQTRQAFESFEIFKDNNPQLVSDFAKVASTV